ncbi:MULTISPECIES: hypothetical protein [Streptomyces]|uniref:Secreted protein n=1 Tax=Streptomyces dengpaensis TaxID=2049881 RepID=A0ABM6T2K8_9ACTN|nr:MULTISPECIES: hypothetical protein [Streptomyces]AVH61364.1 hypothetical protein C4B68_22930 [Streptomyces dengpaensis]PIB06270.1 hypothetical protein B1C81_25810 [Streptomyces sp. HG99]
MAVLVLSAVLVLVVGGCVCVVWAARGGPRWVRVVAAATRAAGELLHVLARTSGSSRQGQRGGSDD